MHSSSRLKTQREDQNFITRRGSRLSCANGAVLLALCAGSLRRNLPNSAYVRKKKRAFKIIKFARS
ncbi:hypothetical protein CAMGR0001_0382 [Campylobacter gracilis RM3268]|uniref:Uncharacterized protein n=1 Tax=Campylobacter gracilis RM3268 TaxID=553220 RepID=C8PHD9_9BACT|nr:hypothetical protein CAMGR0001_0382 [Campylobacter gracilis RM3268]